MKIGITGRIAGAAAARPRLTVGIWAVTFAISIVAAGGLSDALVQQDRNLVTTESETAATYIDQLREDEVVSASDELIVVTSNTYRYGDPAFSEAIESAIDAVSGIDGILEVTEPSGPLVAPNGTSAIITAILEDEAPDEVGEDIVETLVSNQSADFSYLPFGSESSQAIYSQLSEDTLVRGELIGISVALAILVIVFGALVAAGLPLLVAIISIATAIGATALVGQAFNLSFFIVNMITMMGLALSIDYSLIMVQRFREELTKGHSISAAVTVAGNTANRAVLFSGITVLLSLAGLMLVPSTLMRSLGAGAIIVAITSVLSALTLLPAILKLLGSRVNKGRVPTVHPGREPRVWIAIAHRVTRRPVVAIVAGTILLAALASPMSSLRLAFPGTDSLPEDNQFRMAVDTLVEDYGYGRTETLVVVPEVGSASALVTELANTIEDSSAFAETRVEYHNGGAIIVTMDVFDGDDIQAREAIETLRSEWVPDILGSQGVAAYVGGDQAETVDFTDLLWESFPWVILFVLVTSFLLLLVTFRSVVIAGTAIVLNLLSTASAFGLLVAVFQWGWGANLLGMPQVDGIAPWLPLFLFAVLFGLSMDYHVFLISRIKERHDAGDDTRTAVVAGLSRTGSMITGAALIMVAVFSGFALGDLAEFNQMGLGLATAVIIDATVVRILLVPAIMTVLNKTNWYLPRWLSWLPQMNIEGELPMSSTHQSPAVPDDEPKKPKVLTRV